MSFYLGWGGNVLKRCFGNDRWDGFKEEVRIGCTLYTMLWKLYRHWKLKRRLSVKTSQRG